MTASWPSEDGTTGRAVGGTIINGAGRIRPISSPPRWPNRLLPGTIGASPTFTITLGTSRRRMSGLGGGLVMSTATR